MFSCMQRRGCALTVSLLLAKAVLAGDFVTVKNGHFYAPDQPDVPYCYIGANMWYAPILASQGQKGNRERLNKELDRLKELGVNNLRVLVGADASSSIPSLQVAPGVLNDTLLDGLDYLIKELEERKMYGVFYLTNTKIWSGGYAFYLKNAGYGIFSEDEDAAKSADGKKDKVSEAYASAFLSNSKAQALYFDYIRNIISRKNRYTGRPYKESPAIMAWQIANEPGAFSPQDRGALVKWIAQTARLIKEIDPNHLVSTGSEGAMGCNGDIALYEQIHTLPDIDYLTIHLWPIEWGWSTSSALFTSLPSVYLKADSYIAQHTRIAQKAEKPLVIEAFGYPRDRNYHSPGTPTVSRNSFYSFVFGQLAKSEAEGGSVCGVNFWGWGGFGNPSASEMNPDEMEYISDPPQFPQGQYSVFSVDETTISYILKGTKALNNKSH